MNQCYMCVEPKVSDEHVPPLCLFPESKDLPQGLNFRKNLITVPSCAEHNMQKSGDDEYLLFILAANININLSGLTQWRTKIRRALHKRPTKRRIFGNLQVGMYTIDFDRRLRQFDHISRGIYFHHYQQRWPHEIKLAFPFVLSDSSKEVQQISDTMPEIAQLASRLLKDEVRHGENPEIFYYHYKLKSDSPSFILRMVFYSGIDVVAISGPENIRLRESTKCD